MEPSQLIGSSPAKSGSPSAGVQPTEIEGAVHHIANAIFTDSGSPNKGKSWEKTSAWKMGIDAQGVVTFSSKLAENMNARQLTGLLHILQIEGRHFCCVDIQNIPITDEERERLIKTFPAVKVWRTLVFDFPAYAKDGQVTVILNGSNEMLVIRDARLFEKGSLLHGFAEDFPEQALNFSQANFPFPAASDEWLSMLRCLKDGNLNADHPFKQKRPDINHHIKQTLRLMDALGLQRCMKVYDPVLVNVFKKDAASMCPYELRVWYDLVTSWNCEGAAGEIRDGARGAFIKRVPLDNSLLLKNFPSAQDYYKAFQGTDVVRVEGYHFPLTKGAVLNLQDMVDIPDEIRWCQTEDEMYREGMKALNAWRPKEKVYLHDAKFAELLENPELTLHFSERSASYLTPKNITASGGRAIFSACGVKKGDMADLAKAFSALPYSPTLKVRMTFPDGTDRPFFYDSSNLEAEIGPLASLRNDYGVPVQIIHPIALYGVCRLKDLVPFLSVTSRIKVSRPFLTVDALMDTVAAGRGQDLSPLHAGLSLHSGPEDTECVERLLEVLRFPWGGMKLNLHSVPYQATKKQWLEVLKRVKVFTVPLEEVLRTSCLLDALSSGPVVEELGLIVRSKDLSSGSDVLHQINGGRSVRIILRNKDQEDSMFKRKHLQRLSTLPCLAKIEFHRGSEYLVEEDFADFKPWGLKKFKVGMGDFRWHLITHDFRDIIARCLNPLIKKK